MNTVIMRPKCPPEIIEVDTDGLRDILKTSQNIVGGSIELANQVPGFFDNGNTLTVYCNEEGKLDGLPANYVIPGDIIMGTVIAWSMDSEGEDHALNDEECEKVMMFFRKFRRVIA